MAWESAFSVFFFFLFFKKKIRLTPLESVHLLVVFSGGGDGDITTRHIQMHISARAGKGETSTANELKTRCYHSEYTRRTKWRFVLPRRRNPESREREREKIPGNRRRMNEGGKRGQIHVSSLCYFLRPPFLGRNAGFSGTLFALRRHQIPLFLIYSPQTHLPSTFCLSSTLELFRYCLWHVSAF